jgi:hypothetical protein
LKLTLYGLLNGDLGAYSETIDLAAEIFGFALINSLPLVERTLSIA